MAVRKHSPLFEPLNSVGLKLAQSGILTYFERIHYYPIDFTINPNVRTASQDFNQIINLNLVGTFFEFLIVCYFISLFAFALERFKERIKQQAKLWASLECPAMPSIPYIRQIKRSLFWSLSFNLVFFVALYVFLIDSIDGPSYRTNFGLTICIMTVFLLLFLCPFCSTP